MKHRFAWRSLFTRALIILSVCSVGFAYSQSGGVPCTSSDITITISPDIPIDVCSDGTPAPMANLTQASVFAWQEFIALNWPAADGTREMPSDALFGQQSNALVWQTFRSKVEIYPGMGDPPGYDGSTAPLYGYDYLPPTYIYSNGQIPACTTPTDPANTPFINLDEQTQIGQNQMFAGVAEDAPEILFLAKANSGEYAYVAGNHYWDHGGDYTERVDYFAAAIASGEQPDPDKSIFYPAGTIEIKSAWRQLTADEVSSGTYLTSIVRYYDRNASGEICYNDSNMTDNVWGMVALHIIHKTPTAPYFVYATFGQADNILAAGEGINPVEQPDGTINPPYQDIDPLTPNIMPTPASISNDGTTYTPESFNITEADCTPGSQLYYINTAGFDTPQGPVCVNRRIHDIPAEVIAVNQVAQNTIAEYNAANNIVSPWANYKLVNVQWHPIDKPAGEIYTGDDAATYYLANIVVETNTNLQIFSGRFDTGPGLITDYIEDTSTNPATYVPFHNVYYEGQGYNMGGCMGCHGNTQATDFSFILLGGPVKNPEPREDTTAEFYLDLLRNG